MTASCHDTHSTVEVTPAFAAKADEIISHYPVSKRSASLPLLHFWQETHGHINDQGVQWIAAKLGLTSKIVGSALRIEAPENGSGPKLVAQIVAAFPEQVESITLSQPTLEDVFIHLTGRRFEI